MFEINLSFMAWSLGIGFFASLMANIQHGARGTPRDIIVLLPTTIAAYVALVLT